ncbi:MAG: S41 family peptidase [Verrucomicrobiae bacterium]|nr:S41 family peptidase [Verrucomicrobiae bacterium]
MNVSLLAILAAAAATAPLTNSAPGGVSPAPEKKSWTVSSTNSVQNAPTPAQAPARKVVTLSPEAAKEARQILQKEYADPAQIAALKAEGDWTAPLGSTVQILNPDEPRKTMAESSASPIVAQAVIEPSFGFVRLGRVDAKTADALTPILEQFRSKNHVTGVILDLRGVKGEDYPAAARIASLFLPPETEVFHWEKSGRSDAPVKTSTSATRLSVPLVVLVNEETEGAPEILAGALGQQPKTVIVGRAPTPGHTFKATEKKLSDGHILRFATEKAELGKGEAIAGKGVVPDVAPPDYSAEAERDILAKPFEAPVDFAEKPLLNEAILTGKSSSPLPAELEKERKHRVTPSTNSDLVLQRAIDFLKGIRALGMS